MVRILRLLARKIGFNPLAWILDARRMGALVRDFDKGDTMVAGAQRFAVVVTPWANSCVPWLSLATGLLLAADGNKVSFVIDDLPFGEDRFRYRFMLCCIHWVFRALRKRYDVIDLSARRSVAPLDAGAQQLVQQLAHLNAVWALRGETVDDSRQRIIERYVAQLSAAYGAVGDVLQPGSYDVLFIPGGIWGNSGLWATHARAAGIRFGSYDSGGYGTLMLAAQGVACQLQDIPRAFAMLNDRCAGSNDERQFVINAALAEIGRRRAGTDKFASQMLGASGGGERFDGAVLLALNSSWDGAALGLHTVFQGNTQWIVETVRYLLDCTEAPVVVRQHPAERLDIARTSDDYRSLLQKNFGNHPRLHFVAADELVNSYGLLERAAAVVVYTSTIGIEAAGHGKPVITASDSYYSGLGFVWKAIDLATYQSLLSDAASGQLTVTPQMRDDALLCYYLTQCTNWVFTPFNPADFKEWSRFSLDELRNDEKVRTVLKSLEDNIPVSFLNHLLSLQSRTKPV